MSSPKTAESCSFERQAETLPYPLDTPASLLKPLGYGPLGVIDIDRGAFRRIMTTSQCKEDSAPPSHKRCLQVKFSESGELLYRVGMAAHHDSYMFSPEDEGEVRKFEIACDEAADAVSKWTKAVTDAAIAACKEKKNPLNAALAVVASKSIVK